jgi:hypothetical protein
MTAFPIRRVPSAAHDNQEVLLCAERGEHALDCPCVDCARTRGLVAMRLNPWLTAIAGHEDIEERALRILDASPRAEVFILAGVPTEKLGGFLARVSRFACIGLVTQHDESCTVELWVNPYYRRHPDEVESVRNEVEEGGRRAAAVAAARRSHLRVVKG